MAISNCFDIQFINSEGQWAFWGGVSFCVKIQKSKHFCKVLNVYFSLNVHKKINSVHGAIPFEYHTPPVEDRRNVSHERSVDSK